MKSLEYFRKNLAEFAAIRQDLHRHPELMFDTFRTSEIVAAKLREYGCDEVVTGIAKTGVVGVIRGSGNKSDKTIGLRADMDALPIHEETGLSYASVNDGKMHACGHDGHTTSLLAASKYMAEHRDFDGTAAVIFQPAEEGGGGGKVMCDEGMMDRFAIDEVFGMHNWPGRRIGSFGIRPGPFFASADQFALTIIGRGGHAAQPHKCVDTTLVASHVILALQSIVSRNVNPIDKLVVSCCGIVSDTNAHNVIPGRVVIQGTVRCFSKEVREFAQERVTMITESIAASFGATAEVNYMRGYPVTFNHDAQTDFSVEVAKSITDDVDGNIAVQLGAEDFSYMAEERPGAYILSGNGDSFPVHHPKYNFDDSALPYAASWYVQLVEQGMPLGSK